MRRVLDGLATAGEHRLFAEGLRGDAARVAEYVELLEIVAAAACLGEGGALGAKNEAEPQETLRRQGGGTTGRPKRRGFGWAAAALLLGAILWLVHGYRHQAPCQRVLAASAPVCLVRQSGSSALELPDALPGAVRLGSGEVAVRLASGVELTLLGPLELEVRDAMRVRLLSGRLLADVPHHAAGFTVLTPELELWDLGTVFGVSVSNGVSDVFVFQGSVQVNEATGEPVDVCESGEGVRAAFGQRPRKVAADGPEGRELFGAVEGRRKALWGARNLPTVMPLPSPVPGLMGSRPLAMGKRGAAARPKTGDVGKTAKSKKIFVQNQTAAVSPRQEEEMRSTTQAAATLTAAAIMAMGASGIGVASEIRKADNDEPLSSGSSWEGGVAPGQDEVAVLDGELAATVPPTFGLGADVAWQGMRLTNVIADVTVTNDGHTINLGDAGISLGIASGKLLNVYAPFTLTADQTWLRPNWTAGGFNVYGPVSGNRRLTLRDTYFSFYETVSVSALDVACIRLHLRTNAVVTGGIHVSPGSTLVHMKPADADWSDTFPGRVVTNNGLFYFGHPEVLCPLSAVTLNAGDRLLTTATDYDGRVDVYDNRLVVDGGELSVNWLYLTSGSVTQRSGRVFIDYALYAGAGAPRLDTNRIVSISGGTMDLRRLHIGVATSAAYPGVMAISGGSVDIARAGVAVGYGGVELAAAKNDQLSSTSSDPAGLLTISGGSLRTMQISFGSTRQAHNASWNVINGYARVELTGGDVTVGSGGIGPTEVWNRTAAGALPDTAQSWYDVVLSGGTLGAYANYTSYARTRLSDAHGGTVFRAADTNGVARGILQAAPLTGSGGLRKTGAGTLAIAAACTYTGATVVEAGTLRLDADALWEEAPGEALPTPRAVWEADILTGAAGETVNLWPCSVGSWTFTLANATGTWPWITPPTVGAREMNGHRTVAFNGISSAMYVTGNAETPAEGATNLTVAVVMRAGGAGKGSNGIDWRNNAGIIGVTPTFTDNKWGIGYNSYGRAGAGISCRPNTVATAWGAPRNLNDGEAHVLMYVWPGDSNIVMNVDGWRTSVYTASGLLNDARVRGRMMVGATESGNCFDGDIAEIRFYRTAFTPEQQRTLGLELACKYGADTAGYLTDDQLAIGSLASADVRVAAGATLQTASVGTRVRPGQVFRGAGAVSGHLIVGAGGVIQTTTNETLNVAALTFEAGSVCRWPWTPTGVPQAVKTGDLTLPQGAMTVDLGATGNNPTPRGVLLSYTGTLTNNGVCWNIIGGGGSTAIRHDAVNKLFYLFTPTGTLISVR
jgi:autotransporter-associated beta strand protein